jgi:hypothetical protein
VEANLQYNAGMTAGQLIDYLNAGKTVACPKCNSAIKYITGEEAGKLGLHDGIYCTNDTRHLSIIIDTVSRSSFWDNFDNK